MVLGRSIAATLAVLALSACDAQERAQPVEARQADVAAQYVEVVAPLIDPVKLDTITSKRGANRRVRLLGYHLETARRTGCDPATVIDRAAASVGADGTARAEAVKAATLRNLDILGKLGCLDPAGMAKLRTGNAPTITRGPYAGQLATVDHIIPRSVAPELDCRLYNLEIMPERLNISKGSRVTLRQVQLARKWNAAGLLSAEGLAAVERAAR